MTNKTIEEICRNHGCPNTAQVRAMLGTDLQNDLEQRIIVLLADPAHKNLRRSPAEFYKHR
jgi:hypothetical protein